MSQVFPLPSWQKSVVREGRYVSPSDPGYGIAEASPTVLRAEQIKLKGNYVAPSQSIWLIADRVIASGATIDVSGMGAGPKNGISYMSEDHAENGSNAGDPGSDADKQTKLKPATKGSDGGMVCILCRSLEGDLTILANGGRGGNGLNGGRGAKGKTGVDGNKSADNRIGATGGPGGVGGKAGDGGTAGDGGAAGFIYIASGQTNGQIVTSVSPGHPGNPGQPGKPGPPGDPGPPGEWGYEDDGTDQGQPGNYYWVKLGDGDPGKPGQTGPPGAMGKPGKAGPLNVNVPNPQIVDGVPSISMFTDTDWLEDVLRQAEDDFVSEQLTTAQASLLFIAAVAGAERQQPNPVLHRPDSTLDIDNLSNLPGPAPKGQTSAFSDLWARATSLLAQMAKGLSYFGQTRDTVIRRNPQALQSSLDQATQYAKIITERIDRIDAIVADAHKRHDELTDSANLASSQREKISDESKELIDLWNKTNSLLPQLDEMVRERSQDLKGAEESFQQAILNAAGGGGCAGFIEMIKIVGAIAAISQGFSEAIPALAEASDDLESGGIAIDNLKKIAKVLKPVSGDVKSIVDGYNTIKTYLDGNGKGALMIIDESDLDGHVDDVMKAIDAVAEAPPGAKQQLKAAVRDYMTAVKARNDAILQMDAIATKVDTNNVAVANLSVQEAGFRDAAQAAAAPEADALKLMLQNLGRSYLRQLRDFLWQADRAADYFLLRSYSPDLLLRTDDLAQLSGAAGFVILSVQTDMNKLGEPERFPVDGDQAYAIRVDLSPAQKASLSRGWLLVSLSPTENTPHAYQHGYSVFADSVKVSVDGASKFSGSLTHLGRCTFAKSPNTKVILRLGPESFTITQQKKDLGTGDDSGADKPGGITQYMGFSPFSDWLIEFDNAAEANWLKTAKFINIEFTGTMRTIVS